MLVKISCELESLHNRQTVNEASTTHTPVYVKYMLYFKDILVRLKLQHVALDHLNIKTECRSHRGLMEMSQQVGYIMSSQHALLPRHVTSKTCFKGDASGSLSLSFF